MGAIADWAAVGPESWPAVLPAIRAAGIASEGGEPERGGWSWACARGAARVWLVYHPAEVGTEVLVYCPARSAWRRPLAMWRLLRDVKRAVRDAGGRFAGSG